MADEIGYVLDENKARPERCHVVRHDLEQAIVLIRLGLMMVAVPDLTEALAWGTGRQEIHAVELAAVPFHPAAPLIGQQVAFHGHRFRSVVVVDRDRLVPRVVGVSDLKAEGSEPDTYTSQAAAQLYGHSPWGVWQPAV